MIADLPRCMIGTLYVGENELSQCESALQEQTYQHWEHIRFDDLPEMEAHEKLYNAFMVRRAEFDFFIKIDPDMVLQAPDTLARILEYLKKRPSLDHACFSVHDYMSNQAMLGLHVFTNRATWTTTKHRYYPDQLPEIPGKRLMVWTKPAPVAQHSPNPSLYQAFHFGAHRMLKALHPANSKLGSYQWDTIHRIAKHAEWNPDPRLRFALLGSWHVWNGDIGYNANEAIDLEKSNLFACYANLDESALEHALPKEWSKILATHRKPLRITDGLKRRVHQLKAVSNSQLLK